MLSTILCGEFCFQSSVRSKIVSFRLCHCFWFIFWKHFVISDAHDESRPPVSFKPYLPLMTSAPDCLWRKNPVISSSRPACSQVTVGGGTPVAEHGSDTFFRMSTPTDAGARVITGPAAKDFLSNFIPMHEALMNKHKQEINCGKNKLEFFPVEMLSRWFMKWWDKRCQDNATNPYIRHWGWPWSAQTRPGWSPCTCILRHPCPGRPESAECHPPRSRWTTSRCTVKQRNWKYFPKRQRTGHDIFGQQRLALCGVKTSDDNFALWRANSSPSCSFWSVRHVVERKNKQGSLNNNRLAVDK